MNKSPLANILLVVLALSALATVVLSAMYISAARELRQLQTQAASMQNNRSIVAAVANEALEYSKKNPAINPILEGAGIKAATGAPPASTPRPAGK